MLALAPLLSSAWEPLGSRESARTVVVHDHRAQLVGYRRALGWQRALHSERAAQLRPPHTESPLDDALILLQHPPTYTLGTSSDVANVLGGSPAFDLVRTERGGEVTYHGPGQLVLYPLLNLRHYRQDVHWYMRSLEEVAIRTLGSFELDGGREPGLTGVWVGGAKACAMGVKVSRWLSYHGLALNVCTEQAHWEGIVPCGIEGRDVASVERLLLARGRLPAEADRRAALLDREGLLDRAASEMLRHFAEVFAVELRAPAAADLTLEAFGEGEGGAERAAVEERGGEGPAPAEPRARSAEAAAARGGEEAARRSPR